MDWWHKMLLEGKFVPAAPAFSRDCLGRSPRPARLAVVRPMLDIFRKRKRIPAFPAGSYDGALPLRWIPLLRRGTVVWDILPHGIAGNRLAPRFTGLCALRRFACRIAPGKHPFQPYKQHWYPPEMILRRDRSRCSGMITLFLAMAGTPLYSLPVIALSYLYYKFRGYRCQQKVSC